MARLAGQRIRRMVGPATRRHAAARCPAELIHARKPERSLSEQRRQQEQFRALLAESPRYANIIVDTSGQEADATQPVVRAVLSAAHQSPEAMRTRVTPEAAVGA